MKHKLRKQEMTKELSNKVPNGWITATLSDMVINPKSDFIDGPFGSNLKAGEYIEKGVPVFRIQNIKAGYFVDKNIKYVSEEKATELKRHSFKFGDIIITKLGEPLGLCCKVPIKYPNGIIVADLMRMRPSDLIVNTDYLVYAINSINVQNQFKKITKGTTRARVNLTIVREIKIPLAPLKEQARIVSKLDEVISALEKTQQQLNNALQQLKIYKQSVLKAAFEGKLSNNEKQKNWKVLSLTDVCTKITDGSHFSPSSAEEGFPYITVKDVKDDLIDFNNSLRISSKDFNKLANNGCQPFLNDVLFSKDGTVGKVSLIDYEKKFVVLSSLAILRPNVKIIEPKYLFYILKSTDFLNQALDQKKGVAIRRIVLRDLKKLTLSVPINLNEQKSIVSKLDFVFTTINKLEKEIATELKKSDYLKISFINKAFEGTLVQQDLTDQSAEFNLSMLKVKREEQYNEDRVYRKKTRNSMAKTKKNEELKDIIEILKHNDQPISAKSLWQMSIYKHDIEAFYDELRSHIKSGKVIEVLPRIGKESFLKLSEIL